MVALLAPLANARTMRPLFEPTDLEMEPTGVLDIDVQVGLFAVQVRGGP